MVAENYYLDLKTLACKGRHWLLACLFACTFLFVACNAKDEPHGEMGGAELGQQLFSDNPLGNLPSCATCHTIEEGKTLVGPSLFGIASKAADLEATTGLSAEQFLQQSLIDPNAYLFPNYNVGAMPSYAEALSAEQQTALVAYLLTLEE